MNTATNNVFDLEFVDDKEREYFATARLGEDFETFIRSEVGQLLHGRAKLELDAVKDQLLDCNPHSFFGRRKIQKLQNRAQQARWFIRWCYDAIYDGKNAATLLTEYRRD